MGDYFRQRTRLWTMAGCLVGAMLSGWDLVVAAPGFFAQYAVRNDFRLAYAAALVGLRDGYSRLYDLSAQQRAILGLGSGFNVQPFISPLPLAWLVTPLTALPFVVGLVLWTALLVAALLWTWYLLAPGAGVARAAHLLLWLGVFPVAFGVMVGQPGALVAAAVATAWWLLRANRQVAAGLVLSLLVLKPQLALLVPVALLVAGYRNTFASWLVASAVIGVIALVLLGPDGVARYRDVLGQTQTAAWDITRRYSISGPLGLGWELRVVEVAVVVVTVVAAWRQRHSPERVIAAGIVGTMLFTPYLGFQDFLMLIVAGWLIVRSGATTAQVALLVVGYALLELVLVVLAVPILLAEAALLVSIVWATVGTPRDQEQGVVGSLRGPRSAGATR
ncbi:MAG TPA: glycosyltransferase family 87 protein [Candidatus Dormibacteraeota bacterium]